MKTKNMLSIPELKGIIALTCLNIFLLAGTSNAQTVEFFDDFESGTSNWTLTGNWGLSSLYSNSGVNSLTESPTGNYADSETSYATLATAVDLSAAMDANLSFWAIYDIEGGFDYTYVDVSGDGGTNWVSIASFDGENNLTPWIQYTYSLGGFVGSANVKVRFLFVSDGAVNEDGMYIDDFEITSDNTDNAPPLILHTPPELYEGSLYDQNLMAEIIDISGISVAELVYTVDGGTLQTVNGVNTIGDNYLFAVPQQPAGAWIDYWIIATDASDSLNSTQSDTSGYISGNYIAYENAQIDFVNSYGPASPYGYPGAAVRITLPGTTGLVTCLIRNYTDPTRPNDSMMVHIWNDGGGIPGADLITPVIVFPEATLAEPNRITRVDLRPYSAQLSNLSGDIFIGFTVPSGEVWISQTTPGIAIRTFADTGGVWVNITDDYHFRAITDSVAGVPPIVADFTTNDTIICSGTAVTFNDISTGTPASWDWSFPGAVPDTSSVQNPTVTYSTPGIYSVTLIVTNANGSDALTKTNFMTIAPQPPTPTITPSGLTNICQGDILTLISSSTNSNLWSSGETTQTIYVITFGTYTVTVTDSNGCSSSSSATSVIVNPNPLPPDITQNGNVLTSSAATGNQWYLNTVLLPGDTSQILTITQSGDYTVVVVDSNGCSAMSNVFSATYTGINEFQVYDYSVQVYPNPGRGEFILEIYELRPPAGGYKLRIYDVLGREIKRSNIVNLTSPAGRQESKIDLFGYPAGIYNLQLITDRNIVNKKIVIE
ncbi:MAG: PKD domain-containing protein [Bacteroidota bacterium]